MADVDRGECVRCYRHVCLKCGWYKVALRGEGAMPCFRCESLEAVVARVTSHRSGKCPAKPTPRRERCMFCEHEMDTQYMTEVEGEGWECNGQYRCFKRQVELGTIEALGDDPELDAA
jgi:hypothetical protein